MAINLDDNINITVQKSTDARSMKNGDTPYVSIAEANSLIPIGRRIENGFPVYINEGSGVVEYWYNGGINDNNLVMKQAPSSEIESPSYLY